MHSSDADSETIHRDKKTQKSGEKQNRETKNKSSGLGIRI